MDLPLSFVPVVFLLKKHLLCWHESRLLYYYVLNLATNNLLLLAILFMSMGNLIERIKSNSNIAYSCIRSWPVKGNLIERIENNIPIVYSHIVVSAYQVTSCGLLLEM